MKKKILWICNMILPQISGQYEIQAGVKEGWISGLLDTLVEKKALEQIEIGIAFPLEEKRDKKICCLANGEEVSTYSFKEDSVHLEYYQPNLEQELHVIIEDFEPDIIHCFGTEYPHTLAAVKTFSNVSKTIIGIQGLCSICGEVYLDALPQHVVERKTFRDMIKKDSLLQQQKKFLLRGEMEKEAIALTNHIIGRTHWDLKHAKQLNNQCNYHKMNETLRNSFYHSQWSFKNCNPYQIFVSQGDYPIKGLHYLLLALPTIIQYYPKARVRISGNSIVKKDSLLGCLKVSSYGKYIQTIIKRLSISSYIEFLGPLKTEEMLKEYKKAHLFVCSSTMENSPNSVGEAMLLGMPIVAAKVGGIPSILAEDEGYLYDGFDIQREYGNDELGRVTKNLSDAIILAFSEKENSIVKGLKAREHAIDTHNKEKNYKRLIEIYEEI